MTTRTILAAASGGSASEGAIELACRWASRLRAHVEGFHVLNDARATLAMAGSDLSVPSPELFEQLSADANAHAAKTRASFEAIIARHGIPTRSRPHSVSAEPLPSACWRQVTGYAPTLVAERARFFDLVGPRTLGAGRRRALYADDRGDAGRGWTADPARPRRMPGHER